MPDQPLRDEGIEINPVGDGYVVYDPRSDRVHYLNHTAALVLEYCNGDQTPADIAHEMQQAFNLEEQPDQAVQDCIGQLRDEGLILPAT